MAKSPNWDPLVAAEALESDPKCLRRLAMELSALRSEPLPGIMVTSDERCSSMVHALIEGPGDTPYDGGLFHFILFVKPSYPHEPPLARFMTTDHGRVRFNPQFYTSGKVCLSILNTWPGPGWNPAFTLRVVLLQLQALMNASPAMNEPGAMLMNNPEDYNAFIRHETLRVAVLGTLETSTTIVEQEMEAEMPMEMAKEVILRVHQSVEHLEERCRQLSSTTPDGHYLPGVPQGVYAQYATMAQQLRTLLPQQEEEECRICHGGLEDGELIEPCGCSGSMAKVHRACAMEWIRRNDSPLCPICGQAYHDPGLRAVGLMRRYKKRCVEAGRFFSCAGVLLGCVLLNLVIGKGLPVEIAPWEVSRWHVQPAAKLDEGAFKVRLPVLSSTFQEAALPDRPDDARVQGYHLTPPYRISGKQLLPASKLKERWREPLVKMVVFYPLTPWSSRPLPVFVRFEAMARYLQGHRRRPLGLRHVLARWKEQTALEQVRRQGRKQIRKDVLGRGRGYIGMAAKLRCRLRSALEPTPALVVHLRPPYAAEVAVLLVLFSWMAVGVRTFWWLIMCLHLGSRWFDVRLVAICAVLANLLRYQLKRRLTRLLMMRIRGPLEGDLLLLSLLFFGACCAGIGQGGLLQALRSEPAILAPDQQEPLQSPVWCLLVLVSAISMATVAKAPEGHPRAALWHGCAWAATAGLFCCMAALPVVFS